MNRGIGCSSLALVAAPTPPGRSRAYFICPVSFVPAVKRLYLTPFGSPPSSTTRPSKPLGNLQRPSHANALCTSLVYGKRLHSSDGSSIRFHCAFHSAPTIRASKYGARRSL